MLHKTVGKTETWALFSALPFSRCAMPRPKPPGHLFDLVRTKIFARFELVAQSSFVDGPRCGITGIRRKVVAGRLVRDAVVVNFKLLSQDKSSGNSHLCLLSSRGLCARFSRERSGA